MLAMVSPPPLPTHPAPAVLIFYVLRISYFFWGPFGCELEKLLHVVVMLLLLLLLESQRTHDTDVPPRGATLTLPSDTVAPAWPL